MAILSLFWMFILLSSFGDTSWGTMIFKYLSWPYLKSMIEPECTGEECGFQTVFGNRLVSTLGEEEWGGSFNSKVLLLMGLLLWLRLIYDPVYVLGRRNVKKTDWHAWIGRYRQNFLLHPYPSCRVFLSSFCFLSKGWPCCFFCAVLLVCCLAFWIVVFCGCLFLLYTPWGCSWFAFQKLTYSEKRKEACHTLFLYSCSFLFILATS